MQLIDGLVNGPSFFSRRMVPLILGIRKGLGIAGCRVEATYNRSGAASSLYVASRFVWDYQTNVSMLMADFYEKFFGPVAKPMQSYIEAMDEAFLRRLL